MANKKASKNKKNVIIGICSAVAAVILIAVAVVVIVINTNKKLDDSYFVSDGNKYVLTINYSDIASETDLGEDSAYMPNKIHEVYTYSGDTITGLKHYYEYSDENSAKNAFEFIKAESAGEGASDTADVSIDGKYIIAVADESEYSDYTASNIKETIEFYQESMKEGLIDED